jgi:hypothetical protein
VRTWSARQWAAAATVTLLTAVVVGVPTGVVPTPFYTRMTPVLWWNYPVWAVTSVLEGLLIATYVRAKDAADQPADGKQQSRWTLRTIGPGMLSAFAVGCPICNKLVVLAIGVSGALSYWAPIQPVLAVASLALLGYALRSRLRAAVACPVPS